MTYFLETYQIWRADPLRPPAAEAEDGPQNLTWVNFGILLEQNICSTPKLQFVVAFEVKTKIQFYLPEMVIKDTKNISNALVFHILLEA